MYVVRDKKTMKFILVESQDEMYRLVMEEDCEAAMLNFLSKEDVERLFGGRWS